MHPQGSASPSLRAQTALVNEMRRWASGQKVGKLPTPIVVMYLEPRETFKKTLAEFWDRAAVLTSIVDRLMLLQEFAERLVILHPKRRYSAVRRSNLKVRLGGWCWACKMRKAQHRHHVIQVQYGGLNRTTNGVALCEGCHAVVHPWMRKKEV